jgi:hypothetical protein
MRVVNYMVTGRRRMGAIIRRSLHYSHAPDNGVVFSCQHSPKHSWNV